MSRLPEQKLWDRFSVNVAAISAGAVKMWRIENMVDDGTPDALAIRRRLFVPIELKVADGFPSRTHSTPLLGAKKGLSVAQRNWFLSANQRGGECFILVGVKNTDHHYLVNGSCADFINGWSTAHFETGSALSGGGMDFWRKLIEKL